MGGLRVLDLFSCIGCHAIGLKRVGGFETIAFCEASSFRRGLLSRYHPGIAIYDDVRAMPLVTADIVFGGPPCQATSVAAAIHGKRSGESLWPDMLRLGVNSGAEWIVVEQPPGNAAWEAKVSGDLSQAGWHVAKLEFEARDVGAPYERRRVFLVSSTSLPRLEVAWQTGPRAIEQVTRAADARGAWDADQLESLPVDARSASEHDRGPASRWRREMIEALGDSNPPGMAEVIGICIKAAIQEPAK